VQVQTWPCVVFSTQQRQAPNPHAIEFMLAGASAIQVGTANFIDPGVSVSIAEGIADYCRQHGFKSAKELTGALIID
jgi:dihydroorotate dehydrogenase